MASSSNEPSVHYSNFQSSNVDKELKGWAALSAMEMYDWTEELCEELERLTPFRRLISTSKLTYEELDSIAEDVAEKCRLFVPSNGIHFRREKDEHTDPPKEVLRTVSSWDSGFTIRLSQSEGLAEAPRRLGLGLQGAGGAVRRSWELDLELKLVRHSRASSIAHILSACLVRPT